MVTIGLLLVLAGFIYAIPRGGLSGSAALRNIGLGLQGLHATPSDSPRKVDKHQWAKSLIGILGVIVGVLLVHFGSI
jgi:hypothetical protein